MTKRPLYKTITQKARYTRANKKPQGIWKPAVFFGLALYILAVALPQTFPAVYYPIFKQQLERGLGSQVAVIKVQGTNRIRQDSLLDKRKLLGQGMYTLNLWELQAEIQKQPWVKSATVKRILPYSLEVKVEEHAPKALLWQKNKLYFISDDGEIIDEVEDPSAAIDHYILLFGEGSERHYQKLYNILNDYNIFDDILSLRWVGNRRWDIYLRDKSYIKLPEQDMEQALKLIPKLLGDEVFKKKWQYMDLRLAPEKVFVKFINE